jgi:hypothetical protein
MTDEQAKPQKKPRAKKASGDAAGATWSPPPQPRATERRPESYPSPTNVRDAEGRYDGLWVFVSHDGVTYERRYDAGWMTGVERRFYADGTLLRECELRPAREHCAEPTNVYTSVELSRGVSVSLELGSLHVGVERLYFPNGACSHERPRANDGTLHGVERRWTNAGALEIETEWRHGLRHGVERTRKKDGSYSEVTWRDGLPELPARTMKSILGKLAKAGDDEHKVSKAIEDHVPYDARGRFLWSLVSTGQWDPLEGGWAGLRALAPSAEPEDLELALTLVAGAFDRLNHSNAWGPIEGFSAALDTLIERAYRVEDDARWVTLAGQLSKPLRRGVHYVRARLGAQLSKDEALSVLNGLAEALIERRAAVSNAVRYRDEHGRIAQTPTNDPEASLAILVPRVGTREAFDALVVERAVKGTSRSTHNLEFVFPRVTSPEDLGAILRGAQSHTPSVVPLLERCRAFSLAEWTRVADLVAPDSVPDVDYHRRRVAEGIFVMASRAAKAEGALLPPRFDALVSLGSIEWSPGTVPFFAGVEPVRAALAALPAERVHAMAERDLALPYYWERAALFVGVAPREDLVRRLVERLVQYAAQSTDRNQYRHTAQPIGLAGAVVLPGLLAAHDQGGKDQRALLARAIVSAMAEVARRGGEIAPEFDRFIDTRACAGERMDKLDVEWLFAPMFAEAVRALPTARREAAVLRNLYASQSYWTAAFTMVPHALCEAVIDRLASVLAARALELETWDRYFQSMVKELGDARVSVLSRVLGDAGDGRGALRAVIFNHVSRDELAALDASAPAPERPTADARAKKIQKLSDQLELEKVSIYLLERSEDEASERDVLRAGGPAIGVADDQWPLYKKQPMQHVLTLDIELLPDLRERRRLGDARALALFVPDRDSGEAMEKGEVRLLSEGRSRADPTRPSRRRTSPRSASMWRASRSPARCFSPSHRGT